ncbi:hypothetical protein LXL04_028035 [Taraxacum kok-saghyz]
MELLYLLFMRKSGGVMGFHEPVTVFRSESRMHLIELIVAVRVFRSESRIHGFRGPLFRRLHCRCISVWISFWTDGFSSLCVAQTEEEAVGKIGKGPLNSMEAGGKEDGADRSSVWIWVGSGSHCTWVACGTVERHIAIDYNDIINILSKPGITWICKWRRVVSRFIKGLIGIPFGRNCLKLKRKRLKDKVKLLDKVCTLEEIIKPFGHVVGIKLPMKYWEMLKDDVVRFVKEFFYKVRMPYECNSSFITQIPKVGSPMVVNDGIGTITRPGTLKIEKRDNEGKDAQPIKFLGSDLKVCMHIR